LFVPVHRELSTFCQHRVKDCFRHFAGSIDNRTIVSREVQNSLPLYQGCHGSRGDQPQREMAGFVTVCQERFKFRSLAA
jgi:hypothetical protein